MSKLAFVFPGQGAQVLGMGMDLVEQSHDAKNLFDQANELLDFDLYELCQKEGSPLDQTAYTQPALLAVSICLLEALKKRINRKADFVAGLSLGEYSAHVAAGTLSFKDAITLVRKRGLLMEEAGSTTQGTMAAVVRGNIDSVLRYCEEDHGIVGVANFNSPQQIVISGEVDAVERVTKRLEADKVRVIPLSVSGAFHSPLMEGAAQKFEKELDHVNFNDFSIDLVTNVTGEVVKSKDHNKHLLVNQLKESVLWEKSILTMVKQGVTTFVEIGPSNTLAGLIKKIDKNVTVYNVNSAQSVNEVANQLEKGE
jgi:[acyl-carrier-protein] S-malonyltransferase